MKGEVLGSRRRRDFFKWCISEKWKGIWWVNVPPIYGSRPRKKNQCDADVDVERVCVDEGADVRQGAVEQRDAADHVEVEAVLR